MYFVEKKPLGEVSNKFGYTYRGFTAIVASFRKKLKQNHPKELFFYEMKKGRKQSNHIKNSKELIIEMRKK